MMPPPRRCTNTELYTHGSCGRAEGKYASTLLGEQGALGVPPRGGISYLHSDKSYTTACSVILFYNKLVPNSALFFVLESRGSKRARKLVSSKVPGM